MRPIIAPSILAADFANLQRDIEMINGSGAEWLHIDVMDGRFVPNISFGFPVLQAIRRHTDLFLDVHLMIAEPEKYIADFKLAGADGITLHLEADIHLHRSMEVIRDHGMKTGIAINPHTPVDSLKEMIDEVDLFLIMSVNPGFGGQKFIPHSLNKIKSLRKMINEAGSSALIQVDGGVGPKNATAVLDAGANVLVSGSAVFGADDPVQTINSMLSNTINT